MLASALYVKRDSEHMTENENASGLVEEDYKAEEEECEFADRELERDAVQVPKNLGDWIRGDKISQHSSEAKTQSSIPLRELEALEA